MSKRPSKNVSAQHANVKKNLKPFVSSARVLPGAETSPDLICWRFCHVDQAGPWGFSGADLLEILVKLAHFESMTIRELFSHGEEPGKHYDIASIPNRRVRERLVALGFSDMTKISRLRLGGKKRLYGFLVGNIFYVVWWDPEHEVYPSQRK